MEALVDDISHRIFDMCPLSVATTCTLTQKRYGGHLRLARDVFHFWLAISVLGSHFKNSRRRNSQKGHTKQDDFDRKHKLVLLGELRTEALRTDAMTLVRGFCTSTRRGAVVRLRRHVNA